MRLIEIINREPPESERQVVVTVDGKAMTIDAGRSIALAVEKSILAQISDAMAEPVAVQANEGDTAAPTDDETTHDVHAEIAQTNGQIAALDAQIAEMTSEEAFLAPLRDKPDVVVAQSGDYTKPMLDAPPAVTREKLESLTFSQLRELGYQLNVKGTSKEELITDILAAQEPR